MDCRSTSDDGEMSGAASATLLARSGGMAYSSDLSIVWLQDANYASGYDADGVGDSAL